MHHYIESIAEVFKENADTVRAAGAKAYLRNQFGFFGLTMPLRRSFCKMHLKDKPPYSKQVHSMIEELWALPEREFQYFAIELLASYRKEWQEDLIELIEYLITHKSWWDTVDFINSELTGPYFTLFPMQINTVTLRWNHAANIWLQRSSIMFQKSYKKDTDTQRLAAYIQNLSGSKEFFVQKAIGWALREYHKTDPVWVRDFVQNHALAPLSKREALKHDH